MFLPISEVRTYVFGGPAGEGGSHVARLNFNTSRVGVCKSFLSLIVGFAVTVAIWPREVVSRLLAVRLFS